MEYKIQNATDTYISNLRLLFTEEFTLIPKDIKSEVDAFIRVIQKDQKVFIDAIDSHFTKSDKDMMQKYCS